MKNILFTFIASLFFTISCTSQNMVADAQTTALLSTKEFTFQAERISSMNAEVMNNAVLNKSLSGVQVLSYGYGITFKNNEMDVHLPFFGRAYSSTRNQSEGGFNFTSKNFNYSETKNKKGKTIITIKPNDINYVNTIFLEVSANGKAYVSINANDRSPISFSGYISKNDVLKSDSQTIK